MNISLQNKDQHLKLDGKCIYKLTSPNGKIYIGQSTSFKKRMRQYKCAKAYGQIKLYNSIMKYGWDNFKNQIIDNYLGDDVQGLNSLQTYYIVKYNSVNEGLNCVYSSVTSRGRKLSQSHKKKLSLAKKGKPGVSSTPMTLQHKERLIAINTGKHYSVATQFKKGMVGTMKGKKFTEQHKKKLSLARIAFLKNKKDSI